MITNETIKSIYFPISMPSNKYVENVQQALKKANIEVRGVKECLSIRKLREIELINLNWFESRVNKKSLISSLVAYAFNAILIYFFKLFKIKIVFTMHNIITHDAYHQKICRHFLAWCCNKSNAIVVLNKLSVEYLKEYGVNVDKVVQIPMPSYVDSYKVESVQIDNIDKNKFNIVFIGLVRPYKNIEMILELASEFENDDIVFTVCGYAKDQEYKNKIEALANKKNVSLNLKFLDDAEMIAWIKIADAIILPYNKTSSLNSSAAILAFSYATTIIGTSVGTIKEYDENLVYSYEYNDEYEHMKRLRECIIRAYNDFKSDPHSYYEKGKKLQQLVETQNSLDLISRKYRELYESLLLSKNIH